MSAMPSGGQVKRITSPGSRAQASRLTRRRSLASGVETTRSSRSATRAASAAVGRPAKLRVAETTPPWAWIAARLCTVIAASWPPLARSV